MTKWQMIWKLLRARYFIVYTSKEFMVADVNMRADLPQMKQLVNFLDDRIEAEESLEYVKSLLTEI